MVCSSWSLLPNDAPNPLALHPRLFRAKSEMTLQSTVPEPNQLPLLTYCRNTTPGQPKPTPPKYTQTRRMPDSATLATALLLTLASALLIAAMLYPSALLRWFQRKRYQYEVTFSLYMLTSTEKFIFSTLSLAPPRPLCLSSASDQSSPILRPPDTHVDQNENQC